MRVAKRPVIPKTEAVFICDLDDNTRILTADDNFCEILGITRAQLRKSNVFFKDLFDGCVDILQKLGEQKPFSAVARCVGGNRLLHITSHWEAKAETLNHRLSTVCIFDCTDKANHAATFHAMLALGEAAYLVYKIADDDTTEFIRANQGFHRVCGYTELQFTREHNARLREITHPDDTIIFQRALKQRSTETVREFHARVIRRDGVVIRVKCLVSIFPDAADGKLLLCAMYDETVAYAASVALGEAAAKNNNLSLLPCIALQVTYDGHRIRIVDANDAYYNLLGLTREVYAKKGYAEDVGQFLLREDYRRLTVAMRRAKKTGKEDEVSFRLKNARDAVLRLHVKLLPINVCGSTAVYNVVLSDMSELYRTSEEMFEEQHAMRLRIEELERILMPVKEEERALMRETFSKALRARKFSVRQTPLSDGGILCEFDRGGSNADFSDLTVALESGLFTLERVCEKLFTEVNTAVPIHRYVALNSLMLTNEDNMKRVSLVAQLHEIDKSLITLMFDINGEKAHIAVRNAIKSGFSAALYDYAATPPPDILCDEGICALLIHPSLTFDEEFLNATRAYIEKSSLKALTKVK